MTGLSLAEYRALEDLDDVQKVWGNFEIDDAELARLEG